MAPTEVLKVNWITYASNHELVAEIQPPSGGHRVLRLQLQPYQALSLISRIAENLKVTTDES